MLLEGVTLTIIGMLTVFLFLLILVLVMNLLTLVVRKYFPEKEDLAPVIARQPDHAEIALAIALAATYRKR